jgi:hypothetical protein
MPRSSSPRERSRLCSVLSSSAGCHCRRDRVACLCRSLTGGRRATATPGATELTGGSRLGISVNVSARQLDRDEFVDEVADALAASHPCPARQDARPRDARGRRRRHHPPPHTPTRTVRPRPRVLLRTTPAARGDRTAPRAIPSSTLSRFRPDHVQPIARARLPEEEPEPHALRAEAQPVTVMRLGRTMRGEPATRARDGMNRAIARRSAPTVRPSNQPVTPEVAGSTRSLP